MSTIAFNKLTEEEKNKIVEFYYKHKELSHKEITLHFNLSQRALRRILKERKIK